MSNDTTEESKKVTRRGFFKATGGAAPAGVTAGTLRVIEELARDLTSSFGKGWSKKQLHHCLRFAEIFSDEKIVYAVRRELSWTHIRSILYMDETLKRNFYMHMAIQERWSTVSLPCIPRICWVLFRTPRTPSGRNTANYTPTIPSKSF